MRKLIVSSESAATWADKGREGEAMARMGNAALTQAPPGDEAGRAGIQRIGVEAVVVHSWHAWHPMGVGTACSSSLECP